WTCPESHRLALLARQRRILMHKPVVDRPSLELGSRPCEGRVLPLDEQPVDPTRVARVFPPCRGGVFLLDEEPLASLSWQPRMVSPAFAPVVGFLALQFLH